MRLDKFLCDMQLGTRSQVKSDIKKGLVSVNDVVVTKADIKVDENNDRIVYNNKILVYKQFQYYMLHKPAGVVTATRDNHTETVLDLLPADSGKNLSPVGRLDKDTEGLLLITNDGALAHDLLSPKKHVDKKYYVECNGQIDDEKISKLETGVNIGDDELTLPAKVELISSGDGDYKIYLTITEGRFHQVKRMIEAIGGEVTYLKRMTMGALKLDPLLEKGSYRELSEEEIEGLKNR